MARRCLKFFQVSALLIHKAFDASLRRLGERGEEHFIAVDANIATLNEKIPAYSSVHGYEVLFTPFAKTPKGSIKRFMYK